ncbi:uncharacterized protein FN964_007573 isoform 2-T2 [Alca torda]
MSCPLLWASAMTTELAVCRKTVRQAVRVPFPAVLGVARPTGLSRVQQGTCEQKGRCDCHSIPPVTYLLGGFWRHRSILKWTWDLLLSKNDKKWPRRMNNCCSMGRFPRTNRRVGTKKLTGIARQTVCTVFIPATVKMPRKTCNYSHSQLKHSCPTEMTQISVHGQPCLLPSGVCSSF